MLFLACLYIIRSFGANFEPPRFVLCERQYVIFGPLKLNRDFETANSFDLVFIKSEILFLQTFSSASFNFILAFDGGHEGRLKALYVVAEVIQC